ncbi:MAG TPA: YafY family protein [Ktedonobacterales bacterium]|jgi:predicted DNA-binding transcriptional regulator YafY|nr:YafY family protein [Ktedonobacterales bacterium]
MSHTDRLLAIVLELQAHRWRRAEDLARTLETSKRTIYRDLVALGQAGVPIISTPGRGYALMEGYFLPPVSFTADEATILTLGADVMAQSFDAQYRAAAQGAASKITAALPERLRVDVAALRERIRVGPDLRALQPEVAATLRALRGAVIACQRIRFRYYTRYPSQRADGLAPHTENWREADPYALTRIHGAWYLHAYCHLRKDRRNFRLDRIEELTLLDQSFKRPDRAPVARPRLDAGPGIEARVQFDAQAARWAREDPSFFTIAQEETADGGLLVTLRLRREDDVTQWLLSWGSHACVLEPEALRQRLISEAAAMLQRYRADHASQDDSRAATGALTHP